MEKSRRRWWCLIIAAIIVALGTWGGPSYAADKAKDKAKDRNEEEIKLGKDGSVEVEKQYKLVDNKEKIKELQGILDKLAAVCDEPKFPYTVKILDTKDVNALSLPGGPVYVTKGLLDYIQSDHELAAVMAHEVAHIAKHHMRQLIERESKMDTKMMWVMLAAVLAGQYESEGAQGAMLGAQLLKIAKVNGYGKTLETEADMTGVSYLVKANYNPVGMLTFMERLAADDSRRAHVDMGIYQTHPESADRARALDTKLLEMGVKVNRRETVSSRQAKARVSTIDGKQIAEVIMGSEVLFQVPPIEDGKPNSLRAESAATQINQALADGAQMFEITVGNTNAGSAIFVRGKMALEVMKGDMLDPAKQTPRGVAEDAAAKIRKSLWKDAIDRAF